MNDESDPLAQVELTILLGLAFQLVVAEFTSRLGEVGYDELRPMHGMIFQALQGDGVTSTELALRLGVTKQAAGQTIDELERMGYVARQPHPAGGRRRLIRLTPKGQEHLVTAGRVLHLLEAELAGECGATAIGDLRHRLVQVIRSLAGDDVPPLRPVW